MRNPHGQTCGTRGQDLGTELDWDRESAAPYKISPRISRFTISEIMSGNVTTVTEVVVKRLDRSHAPQTELWAPYAVAK